MPAACPLLIAGCGNPWAADDAFGPLVVARLRELNLSGLDVVDLGMQPFGLLHLLEQRDELVLVDAAQATADMPAGQLIDVDFAAARVSLLHDLALSTHGLSLADELELARRLDLLPRRVRLVAATVKQTTLGQPMTAGMRQLVEPAVRCILRIARPWQARARSSCHA